MVKISELTLAKVNGILEETSLTNLKFTPREYSMLLEFVTLLKPFYEVTQSTQGEKVCIQVPIDGFDEFIIGVLSTHL